MIRRARLSALDPAFSARSRFFSLIPLFRLDPAFSARSRFFGLIPLFSLIPLFQLDLGQARRRAVRLA
jgi:hypothetical protein